jgi:hypothetical protein
LHLIVGERSERRRLTADVDVLGVEAVFFENPIVERRIEMHESARDRGGRQANLDRRFARFGQIGIGRRRGGVKKDEQKDAQAWSDHSGSNLCRYPPCCKGAMAA